jgi:hypothetical protein
MGHMGRMGHLGRLGVGWMEGDLERKMVWRHIFPLDSVTRSAMSGAPLSYAELLAWKARADVNHAANEQPVARPPAAGACPRSPPPALFLVLVMF